MKKLFDGIVRFREEDFLEHKELFKDLGESQRPHTLFIGCSDSRVVPNLITRTLPGELFIVRDIANLVPHYHLSEEFTAIPAAIEYAVKALEVENIIICGHSNCGGCAALYKDPAKMEHLPLTRKWMELASAVRDRVLTEHPGISPEAREWLTEQYNVAEQLCHLLSYPFVKEKYEEGKLNLLGWHYIIETGEVFNYDLETGLFSLMN
jgi:carbonic anhydrase